MWTADDTVILLLSCLAVALSASVGRTMLYGLLAAVPTAIIAGPAFGALSDAA